MKRILCCVFLMVSSAILFAGGQAAQSGGEAAASGSDNFNSTGYPIVNEKITLKGFGNQNVTHKNWSELPAFLIYEEKSNIHIEWTTAPNQGYQEKKNILLASGDYPDFFYRAKLSTADEVNYGTMGVLVSLNDLIEGYGANIAARMEEYPMFRKQVTQPDGNIYSLAMVNSVMASRTQKPWINKRWLDNVGHKVPETVEEVYTALKAFKTQDANGNGDPNDELPYSDRSQGNSISIALYGAFGIGNLGGKTDDDYIDLGPDGKVRLFAVSDQFKELLEFVRKLYAEELLDWEMFTQDIPTFTAKGEQDLIGAFFHNGNPEIIGAKNTDYFVACPGIEGPYGDTWNWVNPMCSTGVFSITSVNKYPRETLRWVDYFYGREGAILIRLGIEGTTYHKREDGSMYLDEIITDNPDGLNTPQAIGQYAIAFAGGGCPEFIWPDVEQARLPVITFEGLEAMKDRLIDPAMVTSFTFTSEERERLNALSADIISYVDEMKVKFITGSEPMTGWDTYVQTLKKMGLDEFIRIQQAAYDRYVKS